jgi:hypothetical protein
MSQSSSWSGEVYVCRVAFASLAAELLTAGCTAGQLRQRKFCHRGLAESRGMRGPRSSHWQLGCRQLGVVGFNWLVSSSTGVH